MSGYSQPFPRILRARPPAGQGASRACAPAASGVAETAPTRGCGEAARTPTRASCAAAPSRRRRHGRAARDGHQLGRAGERHVGPAGDQERARRRAQVVAGGQVQLLVERVAGEAGTVDEHGAAEADAASSRSRSSSARDMASAQQDSATSLASDSNAPKPPDPDLSMSRNAVSSAVTAAGAVRFISGLPFLESRQSEGKGGPPSFQTNNNFMPSALRPAPPRGRL